MANHHQNLTIITKLTTVTDKQTLHLLSLIVRNCIETVVNAQKIDPAKPIEENKLFFMSLAEEISKEVKSAGLGRYSVVLGKNFETVIRYDKSSLATFKWNGLRITLFQCPPNPIHSLDEPPEFTPKASQSPDQKKEELLKGMKIISEFVQSSFTCIALEDLKNLVCEIIATYLMNAATVDETKLCIGIRARLATMTVNFNWGLVAGKHFGFAIDTEDSLTKLQCEYKFYYTTNAQKKCFHILLYNKTGVYEPAMQGFAKRVKSLDLSSGVIKSAIFCLVIFLFLWITSVCRNHENEPADDSIISSICTYRSTTFLALALGVGVVFILNNAISKVSALRRRSKPPTKRN